MRRTGTRAPSPASIVISSAQSSTNTSKLSRPCPPQVAKELVKCCVGEQPSYSVDGDGGSVAGLMWRISRLCPAWLQVRKVL